MKNKEFVILTDCHSHPLAHDSTRIYTQDLLNSWIEACEEKSIKYLIFTDHDRYKSGIIFDEFERAKEKAHKKNIYLKLGIELDNNPESSLEGKKWVEKNYSKLDFVLGSAHFLGDWAFDHQSQKENFKNKNINNLYELYYKEIQNII